MWEICMEIFFWIFLKIIFLFFFVYFFKSDIEGWCPQRGREEEGIVLEYSNSWICMNVSPLKGLTTLLCLCSCQILHCNILNILPISQRECCCYGCLLQKVLMTVISANHLPASPPLLAVVGVPRPCITKEASLTLLSLNIAVQRWSVLFWIPPICYFEWEGIWRVKLFEGPCSQWLLVGGKR